MPLYDYECGKCGHAFEERQGIKDDPLVECPVCHEKALFRVIGHTSFLLKGGGWSGDGYSGGSPGSAKKHVGGTKSGGRKKL